MQKTKLSEKQNKKLELICIFAIIIFALASFAFTKLMSKESSKSEIVIYFGGIEINEVNGQKISLKNDMTFTLTLEDGSYNTIEIKDKKVHCIDANCPDKICMHHEYLRDDIDNDMIVCAPHKMTIMYK